MTQVTKPFNIITPPIFHRDYENDLRINNLNDKTLKEHCFRVAQVALPFISLYKPLSQPLAFALGIVRALSCSSELVNVLNTGEKNEAIFAMLQTTISVISVVSTVFAHPAGMLVTTGHDLIINVSQLIEAFKVKDYAKATEVSAHILNNSLHLALFFTGAIEIFVASISIQILLSLYHSSDEFKKGNILEGCAHLLMAAIRTEQLKTQIDVIKVKWELQSLFENIGNSASQSYQSAHAIIVSKYGNHNYVLLGKMKGGRLSTFGGLRDPGENGSKATCAREIEEESLGVLGNKQTMYKLLQTAIQITGFSNGHISYLIPAKFYGNSIPSKFREIRFNRFNQLTHSQKEMVDIVAIRVDTLKNKFAQGKQITFPDNQGVQCSLRSGTEGALKVAINKGLL